MLTLAVLAVYGQTIAFPFVWDDPRLLAHVQETARREGAAGLLSADYGYLDEPMGYWRPVTTISLWLNGLVSSSTAVFHAVNVILYAGCVLLFFRLAGLLLPAGPGAFLAALFFALLPPHTESAALVTNRHDLLAFLLLMPGAIAWAGDREGRRRGALVTGAVACLLAGLSKESALVFPAIPMLFDLIDHMDQPRPPNLFAAWWERNRRWLFAFGAGVGAALLMRRLLFPGGFGMATGAVSWSLGQPFVLLSRAAFYLSQLVIPWPVKVLYNRVAVNLSFITAAGSLCFLLLVGVTAGRRWGRWGLKTAAWAGVFLLPVAGFVPIAGEIAAARHIFSASAGPCLLAGYLFGRGARDGGEREGRKEWRLTPAGGAAALLAAALLAASFLQARVWRDDITLYSQMARDAPYSYISYINLSSALLKEERPDEALAAARMAVKLAPGDPSGYHNLVVALERLRRFAEAEAALRRVCELEPGSSASLLYLGEFLERQGRYGEEVEVLKAALRLAPHDLEVLKRLAAALKKK